MPSFAQILKRYSCLAFHSLVMVSTLFLSACFFPSHKTDHQSPQQKKRWQQTSTPIEYHLPAFIEEKPQALRITNLHGSVSLHTSQDSSFHIKVLPTDGYAPGYLGLDEFKGAYQLVLLEDREVLSDSNPLPPVLDGQGRVKRLGIPLPRCDVKVMVPVGSLVEIKACANLEIRASAQIRALCSGKVILFEGQGELDLEALDFEAKAAFYESTVVLRGGQATFSHTIGNKHVRGLGNVTIQGGHGLLDIEIEGDLFADTALSTGYQRIPPQRSFSHDNLIGPGNPREGGHYRDEEVLASHRNRIQASTVELFLPGSSALEIIARTQEGFLEFGTFEPDFEGLVIHEHSSSSLHCSLHDPLGELSIFALERIKIMLQKK